MIDEIQLNCSITIFFLSSHSTLRNQYHPQSIDQFLKMHLINNNQIYVYEEPTTMAECIEQVAHSVSNLIIFQMVRMLKN